MKAGDGSGVGVEVAVDTAKRLSKSGVGVGNKISDRVIIISSGIGLANKAVLERNSGRAEGAAF